MSESEVSEPKRSDPLTRVLRRVLAAIGAVVVVAGFWLAYAYATTPEALRHPSHAHYHFRLQILVGGNPVNFADAKYQTPENTDICTAALTKEPVHFHDRLDQFVHIHWDHITGGIVLKNYGWNFIGGTGLTLGYRFDQFPKLVRVPIHGRELPKPPIGSHYYVYVSNTVTNPTDYWEQSWDDFLRLNLRDFFSVAPGVPNKQTWLNRLVPTASAHGDDEQLAALNDVLGNVVIFVQKKPPTADQIKARFTDLIPLPESSCGG